MRLLGGIHGHRPEGAERVVYEFGQLELGGVLVEPTVDRHAEDGHCDVGGQRRGQLVDAPMPEPDDCRLGCRVYASPKGSRDLPPRR